MNPNIAKMPAEGRRAFISKMDDPLSRVECIRRSWGLF
jgi:hypothetical protein